MKNNKALITIFLVVLIDLLGFGIILPLLPYIAEKYGGNPLQIGLLSGIYSLFQFISSPILGRLSDRYGRKKMLIISQIGSFVGYVMLGLANSLPLLFISRIIDGATGGNISIAQAYIADVTKPAERAKGMGLIGAAFGLGFIFGPAIGGLLSKFSFAAPAYFAAAVSFITILTNYFFLKETVDTKKAVKSHRTDFSLKELRKVLVIYPLGILIVAFFLLNFGFSLLQGNFALWTQKTFNFDAARNGILFTFIGIVAVLVQLRILPYLLTKFKERALLKSSVAFLAFGLTMLPLLKNPNLLYISLFFIAFGNGLANPTIQSVASEAVPPEEYGGTLGFLQSSGSLGRIVGPILGGEVFNTLGKDSPFYFGGGLVFLTFLYILGNLKE